jgi:hypothetical protein
METIKTKKEKMSASYSLLLRRFEANEHHFKIYHDDDWKSAEELFKMLTQETEDEFDIQMSGHIWELLKVLNHEEDLDDMHRKHDIALEVDLHQLMDVLLFSNDDDGGMYFKGFPPSEISQNLAVRISKWIESQIASTSRDLSIKTRKTTKGDAFNPIYKFEFI